MNSLDGAMICLHSLHRLAEGAQVPLPWIFSCASGSSGASSSSRTRKQELVELSQRIARGQDLLPSLDSDGCQDLRPSLDREADGKEDASSGLICRPGLSAEVKGNSVSVTDKDRQEVLSISLLFSDIVYAPMTVNPDVIDDCGVDYILAIAPRSDFELSSKKNPFRNDPPLHQVWFLCVMAPCSFNEFSEILLRFARAGAVRWDLPDCYDINPKPIGAGGCCYVHLGETVAPTESGATDRPTKKRVAVKVIKASTLQNDVASIRNEVLFLTKCDGHPHISQLTGVFCGWKEIEKDSANPEISNSDKQDDLQEGPKMKLQWSIVMPFYPHGDLHRFVARHGSLNSNAASEVLYGVLSALIHLHSIGILHRDVKAENVLLAEAGQPMLADLGIAAFIKDEVAMSRTVGSLGYFAPELVLGKRHSEKSDVFSTGVVIYFALSRLLPFDSTDRNRILKLTARCDIKYPKTCFARVRQSLLSVLQALLTKEPDCRPSAQKALQALRLFWSPPQYDAKSTKPQKEVPSESAPKQEDQPPAMEARKSDLKKMHSEGQSKAALNSNTPDEYVLPPSDQSNEQKLPAQEIQTEEQVVTPPAQQCSEVKAQPVQHMAQDHTIQQQSNQTQASNQPKQKDDTNDQAQRLHKRRFSLQKVPRKQGDTQQQVAEESPVQPGDQGGFTNIVCPAPPRSSKSPVESKSSLSFVNRLRRLFTGNPAPQKEETASSSSKAADSPSDASETSVAHLPSGRATGGMSKVCGDSSRSDVGGSTKVTQKLSASSVIPPPEPSRSFLFGRGRKKVEAAS